MGDLNKCDSDFLNPSLNKCNPVSPVHDTSLDQLGKALSTRSGDVLLGILCSLSLFLFSLDWHALSS